MAGGERKLKVPTGAVLSKYLRALALDVESINDDGDPITKAQVLAALVWKHALGYKEMVHRKNKDGVMVDEEEVHGPDWRAIETLYNRIEGKIPVAVVEEQGRSLTEKVSELGKARANSLARAAADVPDQLPEELEEEEDA
jgi:hypothetical protein